MRVVFIAILASLLLASCSSPEKAAVNTNETTPAEVGKTDPATDDAGMDEPKVVLSKEAIAPLQDIQAKDAGEKGLGPTDTLRALNHADMQKDGPKIMSLISKASIKMIEKAASEQGMTVEKFLTVDYGAPTPFEREMRNEVIDGDTATVEVKNSVLGSFDKNFLVREDGKWRVALDKIQAEMLRRMKEMQKAAPLPKS